MVLAGSEKLKGEFKPLKLLERSDKRAGALNGIKKGRHLSGKSQIFCRQNSTQNKKGRAGLQCTSFLRFR
jgi:hypothetical protein